jgi:putative component of membrane protein insertase Oxa1/YidC/SpoIIIJ protein YidD
LYAIGALERHGALVGSYLTLKRLVRCGPWCEGGCDPVPERPPGLFVHLITPSSEKKNPS